MRAAIFVGDELTAAGFRLAGVETIVPQPDAIVSSFVDAHNRAALLLVTADIAAALPRDLLDAASQAESPVLAIVPDVLAHRAPPDLAGSVRSALGIAT